MHSPSSQSGEYTITSSDGSTQTVYCSMEAICGSDGGWTRVAHLNMSDPSSECPPGFKYRTELGARACGLIPSPERSCKSVTFPSLGMEYSEICGKVFGYQDGNADGFVSSAKTLDSHYVHGISVTCGVPYQHVWTFVAGNSVRDFRRQDCACNTRKSDGSKNTLGASTVPDFVGNDYFCESAWPGNSWPWITKDFLWDGEGCRNDGANSEGPCCEDGSPWFHKTISAETSDSIMLRLCSKYVLLGLYDIYVK